MEAQPHSVEIDGRSFALWVVPQTASEPGAAGPGSGAPAWEVQTASGERIGLRPLGFAVYLELLEAHLRVVGKDLRFERDAFCAAVLSAVGVSPALHDELTPLALWWATGGHSRAVIADCHGWLQLGTLRVQLRPWGLAERSAAQRASVVAHGDGKSELQLGQYWRRMIAAAVVAVEPPDQDLMALGSVDGAKLLSAVTALCCAGQSAADSLLSVPDASTKELARTTLRLCQALGWTPSQVWATPAAEVDRLLTLLDCVAGITGPKLVADLGTKKPRLSDYADAVTIRVEDA